MKAFKLSNLTHEVWKDERTRALRIRKGEVGIIIEVVVDKILEGLLTYGKVKLQGLFTLDIRKAKGRRIANIQTGEKMYSKDYYKIGLTPSKDLKDGLEEIRNSDN